jgi:hypothetical protein
MLAEILEQIKRAEDDADNIFARAKTAVMDIEKDAALQIDRINAETDAEIVAKVNQLTPSFIPPIADVRIAPDKKKFDAAVKFAIEEFMKRLNSL